MLVSRYKILARMLLVLALGIAILYVVGWGNNLAKTKADAMDSILVTDSATIMFALVLASLAMSVIGRVLGLHALWAIAVNPTLLLLYLLKIGVHQGVLASSWEALQSVISLTLGRSPAYPVILLLVAIFLSASIGFISGNSTRVGRTIATLSTLLPSIALVALFTTLAYCQMAVEVRVSNDWAKRVHEASKQAHSTDDGIPKQNKHALQQVIPTPKLF